MATSHHNINIPANLHLLGQSETRVLDALLRAAAEELRSHAPGLSAGESRWIIVRLLEVGFVDIIVDDADVYLRPAQGLELRGCGRRGATACHTNSEIP